MKKISTFLISACMVALSAQVSAQSQRTAVIETFTGAACPPCAAWNPLVTAGVSDDFEEGQAMYISYQVPIPADDAMYDDNVAGVDARRDYYGGVNAAPTPFSQGQSVDDSEAVTWGDVWDLHSEDMAENIAQMSEFDVTLNGEVVNGDLVVTGSVDATMVASGDFKLRLLITEAVIYNTDLAYPGTNGETEFHHVFKDYVVGSEGTDLENDWAIGDSYEINFTYDLTQLNIYDYSELEITALVQNDDDQYIHQAVRNSDIPITVENDLSAAASEVNDIPAQCSGEITIEPVVTISNTGNNELTSCTITYDVNGGTSQTYDWTGNLSTFSNEDVTLPSYTFTTGAVNTLNVETSNPNGGEDELAEDNVITADVPLSPEVDYFIILELQTDAYANEVYWEVQNSSGVAIASGGNPSVGLTNIGTGTFPAEDAVANDPNAYENETSYSIGIDIPAIDCYTFILTDYYGDGLATYGGSYRVTDSEGNLLIDGTEFAGDIQSDDYKGTTIGVGVEEVIAENTMSVISNPISNELGLILNFNQTSNTSISVVNSQGKTVINESLGMLAAGKFIKNFDVSTLSNGMYFVTLTSDAKVLTEKVVIQK